MTSSRPPLERAEAGSPGSRPECAGLPLEAGEPNAACALPSPPHGAAAGGHFRGEAPGRPEVVEHAHALLRWAVPAVGKFPRSFRFTLGERMERRLYDILECLVRASFERGGDKGRLLREVNVALEVLRHEVRLCLDFRLLSEPQVEHVTRLVDAVGRQVGGWLRAIR